jgi:hypothetical protein
MSDALEDVLRLVADGRLTAEEAAPILDALAAADRGPEAGQPGATEARPTGTDPGGGHPSALRIEVTDNGRKVVNLRIPIPLGRMALDRIPGLTGNHADLVRQALADGRTGTLLVLDDDGDGVRIALE